MQPDVDTLSRPPVVYLKQKIYQHTAQNNEVKVLY